jgi:hypothetical protein
MRQLTTGEKFRVLAKAHLGLVVNRGAVGLYTGQNVVPSTSAIDGMM